LSFDPIPDEVWEEWKWFVCPEGCLLGMREHRYQVENSDVNLTPCYVVNLPKLVMSDVMWASRLENTPAGVVDTDDYLRTVRVDVDSLIEGLIYLLSQHPMVVRRRASDSEQERQLTDALDREEFILVNEGGEGREKLDLADLDVQFFNPFAEGARPCPDMLGMVPAEMCIKELSIAKAGMPDSVVREVIGKAIEELFQRGMIRVEDGMVTGMTPKGKAVLEVEPVHDLLTCKCEVESSGPE